VNSTSIYKQLSERVLAYSSRNCFFFHSVTLIHCRKARKVCQQFIKSFLALNKTTASENVHGFLRWKDGVAFYVSCCHGSSRNLSSNKHSWSSFLVYLTNLLFLLFSSLFCPFFFYCFTSTVSSTPSRSLAR